jgi:hypothetical protein
MTRSRSVPYVGRSQELSGLTEALAHCDALIAALVADGSHSEEVAVLQTRVQVIRREVAVLDRALPFASGLVNPWPESLPRLRAS